MDDPRTEVEKDLQRKLHNARRACEYFVRENAMLRAKLRVIDERKEAEERASEPPITGTPVYGKVSQYVPPTMFGAVTESEVSKPPSALKWAIIGSTVGGIAAFVALVAFWILSTGE